MTQAGIAQITEADIESFHVALDSVAREGKWLARNTAPPFDSCAAFVRGNIAAGHVQLVARLEGRVIGWCDILPRDGAPQGCGIVGMGIVDGHRGQGLGRRLLAQAIAAARAKGMTQIQLDVRAANTAAIALYKKLGFVEQSRYFRDDPGLEGELIVMALPQDAAA